VSSPLDGSIISGQTTSSSHHKENPSPPDASLCLQRWERCGSWNKRHRCDDERTNDNVPRQGSHESLRNVQLEVAGHARGRFGSTQHGDNSRHQRTNLTSHATSTIVTLKTTTTSTTRAMIIHHFRSSTRFLRVASLVCVSSRLDGERRDFASRSIHESSVLVRVFHCGISLLQLHSPSMGIYIYPSSRIF